MKRNRGKYDQQREIYISRINRVIDYIETNIDGDLSLETLARLANFSPFHFHRIFQTTVGETLNQFCLRVRLEKAAMQLISNPKKSVTEIAFDCGFSDSDVFARAFNKAFGMNASQWRAKNQSQDSKICKTNRKNYKDFTLSSYYDDGNSQHQIWRIEMKKQHHTPNPVLFKQVEVKAIPDFHVAYIRHIGPYKGNSGLFDTLFGKLMTWAGPRGLLRFPETQTLAVYHDDPNITDEDKLRTSVCITVDADTPVDGEVGKMVIPAGNYAMARFELTDTSQYEGAWDAVFSAWLPDSGYQPVHGMYYERYLNNPNEDPEGRIIVDICLPVQPL